MPRLHLVPTLDYMRDACLFAHPREQEGHLDVLVALLEGGVVVDAPTGRGNTPLMCVAMCSLVTRRVICVHCCGVCV